MEAIINIFNQVYSYLLAYLPLIITILVVILFAKFILNLNLKKILTLIFNALIGFIVLLIINKLGFVTIPMNILTYLIVGVFGLPGVILLILLALIGII